MDTIIEAILASSMGPYFMLVATGCWGLNRLIAAYVAFTPSKEDDAQYEAFFSTSVGKILNIFIGAGKPIKVK